MAPKKEAPAKKEAEVAFAFQNETKGAIRFAEVNEDNEAIERDEDGKVVGALYIRKTAMKKILGWKDIPDNISITIRVK